MNSKAPLVIEPGDLVKLKQCSELCVVNCATRDSVTTRSSEGLYAVWSRESVTAVYTPRKPAPERLAVSTRDMLRATAFYESGYYGGNNDAVEGNGFDENLYDAQRAVIENEIAAKEKGGER